MDWQPLTESDPQLLDEITAALRDAGIEHRLIAPIGAPLEGLYTSFGQQRSGGHIVEVRAAQLETARSVLREVFAEAEAAASAAAGASGSHEFERDDEQKWRAQMERKQARVRGLARALVYVFVGVPALLLAASLVLSLVRRLP